MTSDDGLSIRVVVSQWFVNYMVDGVNYACVTSTTHLRDCKVAVYVCWLKFIFEKDGTEGTHIIDRQLIR